MSSTGWICWISKAENAKIARLDAILKMKHIFQMAKVKANNKKDIVGNSCVRGQDGQLKLRLKYRLNLWKDLYCEELLNTENSWTCDLEIKTNIGPVQGIKSEEAEQTMLKLKMGKAAGPSGFQLR